MVKTGFHYQQSDMKTLTMLDRVIKLCPACHNHSQISVEEYNDLNYEVARSCDCKNTYGCKEYAPGTFCAVGQCQCLSKEHMEGETNE